MHTNLLPQRHKARGFGQKRLDRSVSNAETRMTQVFFALCKSIGTPVALGAWLRYKYGEHAQLASLKTDVRNYTSADAFHIDYIVTSFLSKYKGLRTGIDTSSVALQAFNDAELACKLTNDSFNCERVGTPAVEAVMLMAQRKISRLLGVIDPASYETGLTFEEFACACKWGPGATFSLKGDVATVDNKICESRISVTTKALPILRAVMSKDLHWARARGLEADGPCSLLSGEFREVKGSKITVVPKNAKTDRTIGVEPTGNLFLQLGVGSYIRRRLKSVGIDLNDQSRNQRLAASAVERGLATIDLKAASDSISIGLILQLFSPDWVELLDKLRSPYYLLEQRWFEFQKWSSMGNGYTFELESLIFWALSSACADHLGENEAVSVYGDDIILPCAAVSLLRDVLLHCGFVVNEDKSFSAGPFRESCGEHFFNGCNVTPVYQKEVPDVLEEVYRLANRIGRLAYRMGAYTYLDGRLRSAHAASLTDIPIIDVVPLWSTDDDGIALPISSIPTSAILDVGPLGIKLSVLVFRPKRREAPDAALLAYTLRFRPETALDGRVTVRRRGSYARRRRWYHVCSDASWLSL